MDLYSVLALSRSCSKEDVKKAFRKKAVEHHPDRHAHASPAVQEYNAECFRRASEAYDILSNDVKREVYNRSGRTGATAAGASGTGSTHRSGYTYSGGYSGGYNAAGGGFAGRNTYRGQGWADSGQQYQARAPRRSFWQALNMLAARTTRGDAMFHALIAGIIVGGAAFAGGAGDRMWLSHNQGKLFADVQRDSQRRAESRTDEQQQYLREQRQQLRQQRNLQQEQWRDRRVQPITAAAPSVHQIHREQPQPQQSDVAAATSSSDLTDSLPQQASEAQHECRRHDLSDRSDAPLQSDTVQPSEQMQPAASDHQQQSQKQEAQQDIRLTKSSSPAAEQRGCDTAASLPAVHNPASGSSSAEAPGLPPPQTISQGTQPVLSSPLSAFPRQPSQETTQTSSKAGQAVSGPLTPDEATTTGGTSATSVAAGEVAQERSASQEDEILQQPAAAPAGERTPRARSATPGTQTELPQLPQAVSLLPPAAAAASRDRRW